MDELEEAARLSARYGVGHPSGRKPRSSGSGSNTATPVFITLGSLVLTLIVYYMAVDRPLQDRSLKQQEEIKRLNADLEDMREIVNHNADTANRNLGLR